MWPGEVLGIGKEAHASRVPAVVDAVAEQAVICIRWRSELGCFFPSPYAGRADEIMRRGREVLSTVPGVQRVFSERAVQEKDRLQLCCLVRVASLEVIDSYREHPAHVAFAD